LAVVAVFMPTSWMARCHEAIGLGTFPNAAIASYLARTTSAFYAMFGGLLLIAASDVRRHSTVISYIAWMGVAYGITMSLVNVFIGMPLLWQVSEVHAAGLGVVILLLQRSVRRSDAQTQRARGPELPMTRETNSQEVQP
jgi:FtsH-binding integral membrane protein